MRALYTAATGMMAQELNVEVISNNIANMRTTGFKRQRAEFQDLMYQNLRQVGTTTSSQGTRLPIGLDIGAGVKVAGTPRVMSQGNLLPTEKDLDVAIRGEGFFRVQLPDNRTAYSRAGSFELDADGRLVTPEGYLVDPAITLPQNAASGAPQLGNPGSEGMGNLLQAQLEQANVNAVTEISDLIAAQRAYSMNAKVVTAADEMLQATAQMMR
jgi:flagellar basal-body rod protein FlgG